MTAWHFENFDLEWKISFENIRNTLLFNRKSHHHKTNEISPPNVERIFAENVYSSWKMVPFPFETVPFVGGSFQCLWLESISFPASEANLTKARQESLKQCFRSSMEEIKVRGNLTQGIFGLESPGITCEQ